VTPRRAQTIQCLLDSEVSSGGSLRTASVPGLLPVCSLVRRTKVYDHESTPTLVSPRSASRRWCVGLRGAGSLKRVRQQRPHDDASALGRLASVPRLRLALDLAGKIPNLVRADDSSGRFCDCGGEILGGREADVGEGDPPEPVLASGCTQEISHVEGDELPITTGILPLRERATRYRGSASPLYRGLGPGDPVAVRS
jgi:hypothetical protein